MICDVSTIVNTEGAEIAVCGKVEVNDFLYDVEVVDASIDGKVTCSGGVLVLEAKVSGQLKTVCARCLAELTLPLSFDFFETLVQEGTEEDKDVDSVIIFEGTEIDVGEIVANNILLNISSKYLCSDDCRGLCPKCGKNLNEETCDCDFFEIDPRWEKLKNFK